MTDSRRRDDSLEDRQAPPSFPACTALFHDIAETETHAEFLYELYAETRRNDPMLLGWPGKPKEPFLRMQSDLSPFQIN